MHVCLNKDVARSYLDLWINLSGHFCQNYGLYFPLPYYILTSPFEFFFSKIFRQMATWLWDGRTAHSAQWQDLEVIFGGLFTTQRERRERKRCVCVSETSGNVHACVSETHVSCHWPLCPWQHKACLCGWGESGVGNTFNTRTVAYSAKSVFYVLLWTPSLNVPVAK